MPPAEGKQGIKVVVPEALKAQLDADAQARGMDRSLLICLRLQESYTDIPLDATGPKLDQLIRDHAVLRDEFRQIVTLLETFVTRMTAQVHPVEPVYPTPATIEETYPELQALAASGETPATCEHPSAVVEERRWKLWPR